MRKILLGLIFFSCYVPGYAQTALWHKATDNNISLRSDARILPTAYHAYQLDVAGMKDVLKAAGSAPGTATVSLPMADGTMETFRVWETPVMEQPLAERYPGIKTYTGIDESRKDIIAKIDLTYNGFHAMVSDGKNRNTFIEPDKTGNAENYIAFDKKEIAGIAGDGVICQVQDDPEDELKKDRLSLTPSGLPQLKVHGLIKRTYRLALATTIEYSKAVGGATPTKASVLSAMVTTINRVNGVYERELAVNMELVANNDQLIYLSGTDPYSNGSGPTMLAQNQDNIDNVIGTLNYDIGHVFSTGGGGIADLACVCDVNYKARGVTGRSNPVGDAFDLDYVAHEIGHQFGATHTFNAGTGSCSGNIVNSTAYEPGSGSTIMAYAGICLGNNVANSSSAYFHAASLDQISSYLVTPVGSSCGSTTATGNTPVVVPAFAKTYSIPYKTPFELTAPEPTDADHDVLTYCWEEFDLGAYGNSFANTTDKGPIFRSFEPTESRTRVFPALEQLLKNVTSYLGEKLPEVNRTLTFKLTVRDMLNNIGAFNFPDDKIQLNVVNTGTPFSVQAPNSGTDYWQRNASMTVSWDVAGTTAAPINCSNVDILLSLDDGRTYSYTLAANTANDGMETVTVPDVKTASARVKVKGVDNVFFDISNQSFSINDWPSTITDTRKEDAVKLYPVPVSDVLHIELAVNLPFGVSVTNALGQQVYQNNRMETSTINVANWAPGVYHLQVALAGGERLVRNFVVQ